ncbi:8-hydroxygeraniol dehydrogenase-like [Bidens hawaiensis]|uniref:8-hydroxygeraniol dehydrogenase-like n=1 Tax=Bidens hawaiensis TaxID=980011 RepID=UPI00404935FD
MANSPESEDPVKAYGYAARDSSGVLTPLTFSRRSTADKDVRFKVLYCGICHSDLHFAKNEWGMSTYPILPGHEIVGVVTEVGSKVEKFKVGDVVGVGCLVGSCGSCQNCTNDLESYCPKQILTYGFPYHDGIRWLLDHMVADEHFVLRWPENLPLDSGAPLLCAGITTYRPLRHFGLDKSGVMVGVVGLGGLGHVAVKFAKALGAEVTVFSTTPAKKQEALEGLKADHFIVTKDPEEMRSVASSLDGIIDTVSATHPIEPLLTVLKQDGKHVSLGVPEKPLELSTYSLIMGRKIVSGSATGGLKETQEMLEFAAKHGVNADIELIPIDYVNTAMDRVLKSDVRYRFVIDVANSLKAP